MTKYEYPLYLTYDERRYGGSPINPEDAWPDYEDEHVEFYPIGLFKDRDNAGIFPHGLMEDEVHGTFEPGDGAYVVIVRYGSGSTFGRSFGEWHLVGVYDNENSAKEIEKSIENHTFEGYMPWVGYFESFESANVFAMLVQ